MAKRRPVDRSKQAEVRLRAQQNRARSDLLAAQAEVLAADAQAQAARARRDKALRALRGSGVSWSELARLTGLSRQALHERVPAPAPGGH